MEYRKQSNGLLTFLEHWWFLAFGLVAIITSQILEFLTELSGMPWIWCYGVALLLATAGVALVFCAKLPLYRQRRFFTLGSQALPEGKRPLYRWGYRCIFFAIALLLCLWLTSDGFRV